MIKDHPEQAVLATSYIGSNRCYVLKSVLLELVWVLSSSSGYKLSRETVHERLLHVLGLPCIECEDPAIVAQALAWYAAGMDFGDALHLAGSSELAGLATFDIKFAAIAEKLETDPPIALIGGPSGLAEKI